MTALLGILMETLTKGRPRRWPRFIRALEALPPVPEVPVVPELLGRSRLVSWPELYERARIRRRFRRHGRRAVEPGDARLVGL